MAFYIAQAGDKLLKVDTAGGSMELTLPAGVTINANRVAKFAILDRNIVVVNAPSVNLQIDANLVVRILTPLGPSTAPSAAAGAAGALTGSFRWLITFRIMDGSRTVSESVGSDPTDAVSLTAQKGSLSNIPVSTDPGVNARAVYRTLNGGEDFFLVDLISDNVTTTFDDNTSDETLSESDGLDPDLGEPPGTDSTDYFEDVTVWKSRLWALSHNNPDYIWFSGVGKAYAIAATNALIAEPIGADLQGATGFARRRNELGVGKRRKFCKVIGTGDETDDGLVDFECPTIFEEAGIWAPASVVVVRDMAYFLAEDGVYRYGPDGVVPVSHDQVKAWFTTDDYFNRAQFPNAFASYNQDIDGYQLFLCAPGSTEFTYWVLLDLKTMRWYGPHRTNGLVPVSAQVFEDDDQLVVPVLGATDGHIYKMNQATLNDAGEAIEFDVIGNPHSQDDPDTTKFWGQPTVYTKIETAGTLTVEARVGDLDAKFGPVTVTSMSRVGSTVTVTTAEDHEFPDGTDVTIAGATQTQYNGSHTITVIDDTTFTFTIATTPTTPATGTITASIGIRTAMDHDMTLDRERLGICGVGRLCEMRFTNDEVNQAIELHGYEIKPVNVIGRR